jgi:[ribosomal protein S5]-alanine N-acetyltransferase
MTVPLLHTGRLSLREMQPKDKESFIHFMTNRTCTRYLLFTKDQKTRAGARRLFDYILNSYESNEPVLALAVVLKDKDEMIGSVGASRLETPDVFECYYILLPQMTGHGYATEAARRLFQFLFEQYKATEIRAYMHRENKASQRVAERLSMENKGPCIHPFFQKVELLYVCHPDELSGRQ